MTTYTATYSPEDNKLRLYASSRLDSDTYARVKAAGFAWAAKQGLFVAPMWTPDRADLLESLCEDGIGDEDTTLAERAEERAERFEDYQGSREKDAERAREAVSEITSGIPMGQPILVGHHSERRARKDAEKIENGMRRAVKMWETAKYWKDRAAGALAHAKYKELPGVRARRIKGLEADLRKFNKTKAEAVASIARWEKVTTREQALHVSGYLDGPLSSSGCFPLKDYPRELPASQYEGSMSLWSALGGSNGEDHAIITPAQASEIARKGCERSIAWAERWISHIENRLTYERAMLAESGGLVSDRHDFKPGGQVLRRGEWFTILRVNRDSVTVSGHWGTTIGHDEIKDYKPPTEEAAAAVAKVAKLPPLCNYPGEGFRHMTRAELDAEPCRKWSDFQRIGRQKATEKYAAHRIHQTRAGNWGTVGVFITDEKRKDPPAPSTEPRPDLSPKREPRTTAKPKPEPTAAEAETKAMQETLRAGVQVVSAPHLFPTPDDIARRLVDYAGVRPGMRVLEPSAGTGALVRPIVAALGGFDCGKLTTIEVSAALCRGLEEQRTKWLYANGETWAIIPGDFLEKVPAHWRYDAVVMNPPFNNGEDIKHIEHALEFLKPGGRLAAICANGPRQQAAFKDRAEHWEELPAGTFAGTNVRAAIVVLVKDREPVKPEAHEAAELLLFA